MPDFNTIGAGQLAVFAGRMTTDGYVGGGASLLANGETGGLLRIYGGISLPIGLPTPSIVTQNGDDRPLASFSFPSDDLPSGTLELGVESEAFHNAVSSYISQTIGDKELVVYGGDFNPNPMMILSISRAKQYPSGNSSYETVIIPNCDVIPQFKSINSKQIDSYQYNLNLTKVNAAPWGTALSLVNNGTTTASFFKFNGSYPVFVDMLVGDGVETAIPLSYAPANATTAISVYLDGTLQTITTHYTYATQTVTMVAAPTAGQRVHVVYEFDSTL